MTPFFPNFAGESNNRSSALGRKIKAKQRGRAAARLGVEAAGVGCQSWLSSVRSNTEVSVWMSLLWLLGKQKGLPWVVDGDPQPQGISTLLAGLWTQLRNHPPSEHGKETPAEEF